MKVLIVGYGSIGSRHCRILHQMGHKVSVHTSQTLPSLTTYPTLATALKDHPDYVVVANATSRHIDSLEILTQNNFKGKVMVEKPLFATNQNYPQPKFETCVGYQLRFHPALQKLAMELSQQKILTLHVYTGQYLPSWRPHANYSECYSAKKSEGGGVLRDLSHELDYINWISGGWVNLTAQGGKFSDLQIDSDDCFSLLIQTQKCPNVSIHINYLDRIRQRMIIANTNQHTYKVDLIQNTFQKDDDITFFSIEPDASYISMHTAIISGDTSMLCTWNEAMDVMAMIQASEEACQNKCWIKK